MFVLVIWQRELGNHNSLNRILSVHAAGKLVGLMPHGKFIEDCDMKKSFSIITATHNAAATLPHLLDSLASQTFRDFELILQDGASTDTTVALAESYRDRLPALSIASEADTGIYDAWNRAAARLNSRWTLFLGADDSLYAPDTLERVVAYLGTHTAEEPGGRLRFAAGGVVIIRTDGTPLRYISGRVEGAVESLGSAAMPTPFPGLFIHSGLFAQFRFDAGLRIVGDYDFLCRAWTRDDEGLRLPFLVAKMREGGVSSRVACAAVQTRELFDVADSHYGNIWTPERKRHYFRMRLVSAAYTQFPTLAPKLHNALRRLRGRPPLPADAGEAAAPFPSFSPEQVPVFIISYNRLNYLKRLIDWLERRKLTNITIIDNASSYPPLLHYLEELPYRVVRLRENLGHLALWKCGLFTDIVSSSYFILSDPDVVPVEECPDDVIECFYNKLVENPSLTKCGFSLLLEDIPHDYPLRDSVMKVESPYWENPLPDGSGYTAPLDTTFALYRPGVPPEDPRWFSAVRLAPPYAARHLPWYETGPEADGEGQFYREHCRPQFSFWSAADADSLKQENLALRRRVEALEAQVAMLEQSFGNRLFLVLYKVLRALKKKILG